ncbi:cytochrome-c peroxidase [Undibacterium terreum]|uniref:Cytochrome-c methylamine utilization protein n=1 Tax=Undibacterium terreum TaxID=1224302 RepID=A0A916XBV8_9BURK|nr:cytochrome c peroxidase [Undibacterium terreum]GGC60403.1 cytochrome-c methylamine utilization protein [Undibacterium terreum]
MITQPYFRRPWAAVLLLASGLALLLAAAPGTANSPAGKVPPLLTAMPDPLIVPKVDPALAVLGRKLFFDQSLSEPRGTSCAACHVPEKAFSGNHGSGLGVALGSKPGSMGTRNTPSLLYLRYTPSRFFYQDDDALLPTPFGGFFADGRADTLAEQAMGPLLNPMEMNNKNALQIAKKLEQSHGVEMRSSFGKDIFRHPEKAASAAGLALEAFLRSEELSPFSSPYDDHIRGKKSLGAAELKGLKLFKDTDKGNCASCHKLNETSNNPARSLFTDFSYDAIAVPRNSKIPANRNKAHYDKGLCETAFKLKWNDPEQWCAYFKTPSLRNVAVRENYMHNGVFTSLRDVVGFYATRATSPEDWYKSGVKFDDVPARYQGNININSVPYNRPEGSKPALTEEEIDYIVSFLKALTDAPYVNKAADKTASRK